MRINDKKNVTFLTYGKHNVIPFQNTIKIPFILR